MNKTNKRILICAAIVLAVVLGAGAFFGIQGFKNLSGKLDRALANSEELDGKVAQLSSQLAAAGASISDLRTAMEEKELPAETQENDIVIASEYKVLSTEQISAAYLNGDASSLSDKDKETLDLASAVLDEIITEGMDDYEKELAVYEWMINNLQNDPGLLPVVPTTRQDCDNPYGVLKYHNAVCVGYATTFRLFMEMLKIPCMVVHNLDYYHTWDLVQVGGHWYHTDIYSDVNTAGYAHFNRTDSMQGSEQTWDRDFYPHSDSEEACYAVKNAVEQKDVFEIPAILREGLNEGTRFMAFSIPKEEDNRSVNILETMMTRLEQIVEYSEAYSGTDLFWQWVPLDDRYVISVSLPKPNSESGQTSSLDDEDLNRIELTLDEVFGDMGQSYIDPYYPSDQPVG